jgi:tRNA dimethylallyltransferase
LAAVDPESAALIHPNNVRRAIRAFEWLEQESSYVEQSQGFAITRDIYPTVYLGLTLPREQLYERINARVTQMIEQGLLEEVQRLLSQGYERSLTAQQAIGYKEMALVLDGKMTLREASEATRQATRRYAKRQMTWFNRDPRIEWIDVSDLHRQVLDGAINSEDFRFMLLSRAMQLLNSASAVL